jgi:hypothetical protein
MQRPVTSGRQSHAARRGRSATSRGFSFQELTGCNSISRTNLPTGFMPASSRSSNSLGAGTLRRKGEARAQARLRTPSRGSLRVANIKIFQSYVSPKFKMPRGGCFAKKAGFPPTWRVLECGKRVWKFTQNNPPLASAAFEAFGCRCPVLPVLAAACAARAVRFGSGQVT